MLKLFPMYVDLTKSTRGYGAVEFEHPVSSTMYIALCPTAKNVEVHCELNDNMFWTPLLQLTVTQRLITLTPNTGGSTEWTRDANSGVWRSLSLGERWWQVSVLSRNQ